MKRAGGDVGVPYEELPLRLPEVGRMVLLCCGSMGCGPMEELTEELSGRLPEGAFLVVICGTNTVLREKLAARGLKRTRVVGFTEKMSLYMDAADLYLTKAGGLSTTEALVKRLSPFTVMAAVSSAVPSLP